MQGVGGAQAAAGGGGAPTLLQGGTPSTRVGEGSTGVSEGSTGVGEDVQADSVVRAMMLRPPRLSMSPVGSAFKASQVWFGGGIVGCYCGGYAHT